MQRFRVNKRDVFTNKYVDSVSIFFHVIKHDGMQHKLRSFAIVFYRPFGAQRIVKTRREQNIFRRINTGCVTNDYTQKCEFSIPPQEIEKDQTLLRAL
jgi:hypothetical protein